MTGQGAQGYSLKQLERAAGESALHVCDGYASPSGQPWMARADADDTSDMSYVEWFARLRAHFDGCQDYLKQQGQPTYPVTHSPTIKDSYAVLFSGPLPDYGINMDRDFYHALVTRGDELQVVVVEDIETPYARHDFPVHVDQPQTQFYGPYLLIVRHDLLMVLAEITPEHAQPAQAKALVDRGILPVIRLRTPDGSAVAPDSVT